MVRISLSTKNGGSEKSESEKNYLARKENNPVSNNAFATNRKPKSKKVVNHEKFNACNSSKYNYKY